MGRHKTGGLVNFCTIQARYTYKNLTVSQVDWQEWGLSP